MSSTSNYVPVADLFEAGNLSCSTENPRAQKLEYCQLYSEKSTVLMQHEDHANLITLDTLGK